MIFNKTHTVTVQNMTSPQHDKNMAVCSAKYPQKFVLTSFEKNAEAGQSERFEILHSYQIVTLFNFLKRSGCWLQNSKHSRAV